MQIAIILIHFINIFIKEANSELLLKDSGLQTLSKNDSTTLTKISKQVAHQDCIKDIYDYLKDKRHTERNKKTKLKEVIKIYNNSPKNRKQTEQNSIKYHIHSNIPKLSKNFIQLKKKAFSPSALAYSLFCLKDHLCGIVISFFSKIQYFSFKKNINKYKIISFTNGLCFTEKFTSNLFNTLGVNPHFHLYFSTILKTITIQKLIQTKNIMPQFFYFSTADNFSSSNIASSKIRTSKKKHSSENIIILLFALTLSSILFYKWTAFLLNKSKKDIHTDGINDHLSTIERGGSNISLSSVYGLAVEKDNFQHVTSDDKALPFVVENYRKLDNIPEPQRAVF